MRLNTTTNTAVTISQASRTLTSLVLTPWTSRAPMPCQENTRSVMTAPPNTAPMSIATTVTSGIRALRRAWRVITRDRDSPLALASRM